MQAQWITIDRIFLKGSSNRQSNASSAFAALTVVLCLSGILCSVPATQYRSGQSGPSGSFPKKFIWASGTAPHQVEGDWDTDGKNITTVDVLTHLRENREAKRTAKSREFTGCSNSQGKKTIELSNPRRVEKMGTAKSSRKRRAKMAAEDAWKCVGSRNPDWRNKVCRESSRDNSTGEYDRVERYIAAAKLLGLTHYRFSMTWARLFPGGHVNGTSPNVAALCYYQKLIVGLLAEGIIPIVTLYHWNLPRALNVQGGWLNGSTVNDFVVYAAFCFKTFGDRVKMWLTFHDPLNAAIHGYGTGRLPPGHQDPNGTSAFVVAHNMLLAHAKVYRLYQYHFKPLQAGCVSLVLASPWMKPTRSNGMSSLKIPHQVTLDATLGWFAKPIFGDGFYPEALQSRAGIHLPRLLAADRHIIHGSADFFALSFGPTSFRYLEPWQLLGQVPSLSLRPLLTYVDKEYGNPPILLADCGWFVDAHAGTEDTTNLYMLKSFLYNALQAVQHDGVNLIGFTVWPLLDGFDWSLNVQQGLFLMDFKHEDVLLKSKTSALLYRDIVAKNGFGSAPPFHHGMFPCGFTWGAMDTAIQVEITSSYHGIYLWNVSGDGHLHSISSAHYPQRSFHCSEAASVRHLISTLHWLGITHYRFTLDWGLLLPDGDPSRCNIDALQFYHCFVKELRKAAIQPVATLHRPWDPLNRLPIKLQIAGGWKNPSIVSAFKTYADLCFKTFGYDIKSWVTLDEPNRPNCLWKNGIHKNGKMSADESTAGQKDDIKNGDLNNITHNLFRAHVLTWQTYDNHYRAQQGGHVGLALLADWYKPANPYMLRDQRAATDALVQQLGPFADELFSAVPKFSDETTSSTSEQANSSVPLKTSPPSVQTASSANDTTFPLYYGACDFLGLNHFTTWLVGHNGWVFRDITMMRSPLDKPVEPQGLRQLLNWIRHRYGDSMVLMVTANGIDDRRSRTDHLRVIYHQSYLNELLKGYHGRNKLPEQELETRAPHEQQLDSNDRRSFKKTLTELYALLSVGKSRMEEPPLEQLDESESSSKSDGNEEDLGDYFEDQKTKRWRSKQHTVHERSANNVCINRGLIASPELRSMGQCNEEALSVDVQQVYNELQFILSQLQSHTLDVEQLTGALHRETQGKHRLSSSFKTLKELNDNLKYQVTNVTEENQKLKTQTNRLQRRLENLQRRQDLHRARARKVEIPAFVLPGDVPRTAGQEQQVSRTFGKVEPPRSKPGSKPCKHLAWDLTGLLLEWLAHTGLGCGAFPGILPKRQPYLLSEDVFRAKCCKVLPLLVNNLCRTPPAKYQLSVVNFLNTTLSYLHDQAQHTGLTATYRRLGEELFKGGIPGETEKPCYHTNWVELKSIATPKPGGFFRSADLETRFLSSLIIFRTLSQVDLLAQVWDTFRGDLQDLTARHLFLQHGAIGAIIHFLRPSARGLLSSAIDSLLLMAADHKVSEAFIAGCGTEAFFRSCVALLRSPRVALNVLEKLSMLLQNLSVHRKLFEKFGLPRLIASRCQDPEAKHAFLTVNLRSVLLNLGLPAGGTTLDLPLSNRPAVPRDAVSL
uniref:Beta-glucosidase n=1 Tax=Eptatretus burgeri TaxID=7764 RepID=A0A8C4QVN3_EPTBU